MYLLSTGGCDWCTKHGQEELPQVRGQGQKLGGPHARRAAAKRSYPTSEVRGCSQECQAVTAQEWLRWASCIRGQGWRLGGASGREELPHARGQGQWLGGATLCPRRGGCTGAGGPRGAIPRWRSGRVAVKRYSSSKVRETQVRR